MSYEDYAGLYSTGHENKEPVKPEDEFYHSLYIAGAQRLNHINIAEEIGKLQVRGVEYNKDMVHFIITHTKQVLSKSTRDPQTQRENLDCFCYQEGDAPWFGTSLGEDGKKRMCGTNSAERASNPYCNTCRAQMIVAGLYCDANGKPFTSEEGKPTFIFIRGKGMKYSGVANYLNEMSKLDIKPLFSPPTEQSMRFEKAVVNNKRYVTVVNVTEESSNFGMKKVFNLQKGTMIPDQSVMEILKVAKNTLEKFNEKMDWSSRTSSSGYAAAGTQIPDTPPADDPPFGHENTKSPEPSANPPAAEGQTQQKDGGDSAFSFNDLKF
jgi:hypothetical protein